MFFLSPSSQGWVERAKGWQRCRPTFVERGGCQDSMVYPWVMLLSASPCHATAFLVLISFPFGLGSPRIIPCLIRRKYLAWRGD